MFWLVRPASTRVMVSNSEICHLSARAFGLGFVRTAYRVVVGVVALERVSDLGNIIVVAADSLEDALNGSQSNTADTASLSVLEL
jgi:hypothetical protein